MGQRSQLEPNNSDFVSTVTLENPIYLLVAIGLVILGISLLINYKRTKRRRAES